MPARVLTTLTGRAIPHKGTRPSNLRPSCIPFDLLQVASAELIGRKRGPNFYAKFRVNGHQTTRLIGPAWLKRGRPPEGYFTRQMAEVELHRMWTRRGQPRTGSEAPTPSARRVTNGSAYLEQEKQVAELTLNTDRSAARVRLIRFFGADTPIMDITTKKIDAYRAHSLTVGGARGRPVTPSRCSAT
jgi:hypothetical protein